MNHLKILGLTAVAAALMAIAGVGTASATVLCHSTSTPCSQKWGVGTEVEFTLTPSSSGKWMETSGTTATTCTEATIRGSISSAGSETGTVTIPVSAANFVWPKCSSTSESLANGELEIHAIAGSDDGTVTASGFDFTTTIAGVTCGYYFPEATHFGSLTHSETGNAQINIGTVLTKKEGSFLCPGTLSWIEEFTQTRPSGTPLFVEPS